ncbi:hypothetical protein KD913_23860 [Klebsiella pneumoniae]
MNHSTGKNIGIYPEIKAPWFHHREGKDIAASTLKVLKEYGYTSKQDKVYLQCFDANELKRIKNELEPKMGMDLNLVQLIAYTDWNETQQKQADGKWVNYSYDWMFKPGDGADCAVRGRYRPGLPYAGSGRLEAGGGEADGDGERGACQPSAGASVHRARGSVAGVRD